MAELIGIDDTWIRWRNHTNVKDFNELKTPGFYQIQKDEDTLNAPPSFGIIEVLAGKDDTSIIQRATDTTGVMYVRGFSVTDKKWHSWKQI